MSLEIKTVKHYILHQVIFSTSEYDTNIDSWFTTENEAKKIANLKRGWYGSSGQVHKVDLVERSLPTKYYETADEWAKDNLTYNEYMKFKI